MLEPFQRNTIELPVSDRVFGATIIKQRARFDTITITQAAVQLLVLVTPYAATPEGGVGEQLPADFPVRRVVLMADNNTAVDAQTGAIHYIRLSATTVLDFRTQQVDTVPLVPDADNWQTYLNAKEEPLLLQGDFFCHVRDTQDVRIRSLIEQHIAQADQMGRFA